MVCFVFLKKITPGRKMIISHLYLDIKKFIRPFLIDRLERERLKAKYLTRVHGDKRILKGESMKRIKTDFAHFFTLLRISSPRYLDVTLAPTKMTESPTKASSLMTALYTSWLNLGGLSFTSVRLMLTVATALRAGVPPSLASTTR